MAPTAAAQTTINIWAVVLRGTLETLDLHTDEVPDELTLAQLVSQGLPARAIEGLIEQGFPEGEIFRFVIPRRTLQRRRQGQETLTPDESSRAERMARILALARGVLGDKKRALQWLLSPKRQFNEQRPIDLIESSVGFRLVEDALLQAYFGNVA